MKCLIQIKKNTDSVIQTAQPSASNILVHVVRLEIGVDISEA